MKKMGGSKIILVVLMIFILLISLYIAADNILYPKITLKKGDLIIGLNSKDIEPGYAATYKIDATPARDDPIAKVSISVVSTFIPTSSAAL